MSAPRILFRTFAELPKKLHAFVIFFVESVSNNYYLQISKRFHPVDTRSRFNVDTTSHDVVSTLKRRCVSTGQLFLRKVLKNSNENKGVVSLKLQVKSSITNVLLALYKNWSFSWRISSVNSTKSAISCGFGRIYWWNT